jgi:hypothetical protein
MYGELYQYLILHQQLHLPGIGTFAVEKKPASLEFADKLVHPPAFSIVLSPDHYKPSKNFFYWLGTRLGISERDAVIRFNDFLFDLRNQLSAGSKLQWSGVGTISKGAEGAIRLEAACKDHTPASPVPAVMVLRHNAEHTVLVGEQERTSGGGKVITNDPAVSRKSRWWIAALIAGAASVIFITYYFSLNGSGPSSAANRQKLVPQKEAATH